MTKHLDGCLLLFQRHLREGFRAEIAKWPISARAWQSIFLGKDSDVEFDTAGCILIATKLRAAVGLMRDIMLMGMGSHFEIWDAAKLAKSESNAIAVGVPDVLNNFSF